MTRNLRSFFLQANTVIYQAFIRRLLFRLSAQTAHEQTIRILALCDRFRLLQLPLRLLKRASYDTQPIEVAGVTLDFPLILAAGFVKGHGYETEEAALAAVEAGTNIIPGWRSMPLLVGMVEFGSFTRWPRVGNPGIVMWRDPETKSTQNRVGLKNPGAFAAAAFLAKHRKALPETFGINIAVSPGVDDNEQEKIDVLESIEAFLQQNITPAWFTLNLSCPNTDDDPSGNQTEDKARELCAAVVTRLNKHSSKPIPLWVKIGPNLGTEQYTALMRAFSETGVRAVIATNTLPAPTPDDPTSISGIGGGRLHSQAIEVTGKLMMEKIDHKYEIDIIGCGGILSGESYQDYKSWGVDVVQYWSALIYRGPLAAAMILDEA